MEKMVNEDVLIVEGNVYKRRGKVFVEQDIEEDINLTIEIKLPKWLENLFKKKVTIYIGEKEKKDRK